MPAASATYNSSLRNLACALTWCCLTLRRTAANGSELRWLHGLLITMLRWQEFLFSVCYRQHSVTYNRYLSCGSAPALDAFAASASSSDFYYPPTLGFILPA